MFNSAGLEMPVDAMKQNDPRRDPPARRTGRAVALAAVCALLPLAAWPGIRGSSHDFTKTTWSTKGETCSACHTPHAGKTAQAAKWNPPATKASFTLYKSPTLDATPQQPNPSSKACLSCHDGTVAMNSYGGKMASPEFMKKGPANLGTDLSDDHPISIRYDSALARKDGGLHDPTTKTVPSLGGQTIQRAMLVEDFLECSSCHDVHRSKGHSKTSEGLSLINNDNSALCLTCHNK